LPPGRQLDGEGEAVVEADQLGVEDARGLCGGIGGRLR